MRRAERTTLGWVAREGQEAVPQRLDDEEPSGPPVAQEEEDEDDGLDARWHFPDYYDGKWYANGQWHRLKDRDLPNITAEVERWKAASKEILEDYEEHHRPGFDKLQEIVEMEMKGPDHYPREWGETTSTSMDLTAAPGGGDEDHDNWELLRAADEGDASLVSHVIDAGADVTWHDPAGGRTALHLAARRGRVAVMEEVLRRGADVEARDAMGRTALHEAVRRNQTEAVLLLVDKFGANISATDDDGLDCHTHAIESLRWDAAEILIDRGATCSEEVLRLAKEGEAMLNDPARAKRREEVLTAGFVEDGKFIDHSVYLFPDDPEYQEHLAKQERQRQQQRVYRERRVAKKKRPTHDVDEERSNEEEGEGEDGDEEEEASDGIVMATPRRRGRPRREEGARRGRKKTTQPWESQDVTSEPEERHSVSSVPGEGGGSDEVVLEEDMTEVDTGR